MTLNTIPKKLHIIWVGDESKRPDQWIQTWRDKHPAWEFKLWGNEELNSIQWQSQRQIDSFISSGHWEGVADLMRYEILCEHGGVYVDADSMCVRTLDDWLLETRLFAIWESEQHRPGLIANGFIGAVPRHPVFKAIIRIASKMNKPVSYKRDLWTLHWEGMRPRFKYKSVNACWETVGPLFFTKIILSFIPTEATILPSILFLPKHHSDMKERESSLIYAKHEWGSTHKSY